VSPGYLNRQSLLGEHRELHGLYSILVHGKTGYARHPESVRWVGCLSALARRHSLLSAEMALRGYTDRSPVVDGRAAVRWPTVFVTPPAAQFALLGSKYEGRASGRIALPANAQALWAQHKYSVLARDQALYRTIGRRVARLRRGAKLAPLADELVSTLRIDPAGPSLVNALEHMWGHVSKAATAEERQRSHASTAALLRATTQVATRVHEPYLMASTALGDLSLFVSEP
jgi:hypothetical protein